MSKRWILLMGLLAVCGLVACQSAATPTLEPAATATQPEATATEAKDEPAPTQVQKSAPTATLAAASEPGAAPTPAWQIPELQDSDWTKGAEDAGLIIVEYSDYQ
jgi:hypothetical protein